MKKLKHYFGENFEKTKQYAEDIYDHIAKGLQEKNYDLEYVIFSDGDILIRHEGQVGFDGDEIIYKTYLNCPYWLESGLVGVNRTGEYYMDVSRRPEFITYLSNEITDSIYEFAERYESDLENELETDREKVEPELEM